MKMIVFDVDGVLIDSYNCLPSIYESIGRKYFFLNGKPLKSFVDAMLIAEDFNDFYRRYPPSSWWPSYFRGLGLEDRLENINVISHYYWKERMRRSVLVSGVRSTLSELIRRGYVLAVVCGTDGIPGMKQQRIQQQGLDRYFSEILIEKENILTKTDGIKQLLEKHGILPKQLLFLDDKIQFLKDAVQELRINGCLVRFTGPLRLAWQGQLTSELKEISNLTEILTLIGNLWEEDS